MHIKKNSIIVVAITLLAMIIIGITNVSQNFNTPTTANAAHVTEPQGTFPKNDPRSAIPVGVDHDFTKNGVTFNVETTKQILKKVGHPADVDPIITGINGNNNVSNNQVMAALRGKVINTPAHDTKNKSSVKKTNDAPKIIGAVVIILIIIAIISGSVKHSHNKNNYNNI